MDNSFYIAAFERAPIAAVVLGADASFMQVNHAFTEQFGYSLQQLQSVNFLSLSLPSNRDGQLELEGAWEGEAEIIHASGRRCSVFISSVPQSVDTSGSGECFIVYLFLADSRKRKSSLHKLESLGAIAGTIAHDLNNILTGILGHVSFLRLSLGAEAKHIDSVHAIEDGARRAAAMIRQILGYTREEKLDSTAVDFSNVVESGSNLIRGALSKHITLSLVHNEPSLMLEGDEGKLSQLFLNLAVNARDALPDGGEIQVRLERVVVDATFSALHPGLNPGEYARLKITDNGMGMSDEVKARMFEPFFTTKDTEGTGLGLATVIAIVQEYKGFVHVDSKLGSGSTFEVYLEAMPAVDAQLSEEEAQALLLGDERILVVDDEEVVREIIKRSLEHLGYSVDVAEDGLRALELYQRAKAKYSLVILDMMMPKMAGEEVFKNLRQLDDSVRVLLVSGYTSQERAKTVLDAGRSSFIQKPFAVEELAHEVRACLDD